MIENAVWVWLGLLVVLILAEITTVQLTTIWFAGGALVALILAAVGIDSLIIQITAFIAVSVILLIATRPIVKKYINKKSQPTNADRCIGQSAIVTEDIDNILGKGAARINGTEWTARSENGDAIAAGATVTVVKIEGVKLIVRKSEVLL